LSLLCGTVGLPELGFACGDFFWGSLMERGDKAVLVSPTALFEMEVARMPGVRTPFRGESRSYFTRGEAASSAGNVEVEELRICLRKARVSPDRAEKILQEHGEARDALNRYLVERERWENAQPWHWENEKRVYEPSAEVPPVFPNPRLPSDLPPEFADYLRAAFSWHNPADNDKQAARRAWERILDRPEDERRFKSTWAAYMLGKYWEEQDPEQAAAYFARVRALARMKFRDPLDLAASSIGLEGRIRFRQKNYESALELYSEHLATGDQSATNSLRFVAAQAVHAEPEMLVRLAKNPRTQPILTSYLISQSNPYRDGTSLPEVDSTALRWLTAVESADIKNVESAEKLALAAYKFNCMDQARRWLKRSGETPLSLWLQAKLLLRAGKQKEGARTLKRVVAMFPLCPADTNVTAGPWYEHTLIMEEAGWRPNQVSGGAYVRAELGMLQVSRGEYTQALDNLLNSGFWSDAAYVAERVLTLDELKSYVDNFWPAVPEETRPPSKEGEEPAFDQPSENRKRIRYLLARRLLRSERGNEARPYYPYEWLPAFDSLVATLSEGWNESAPAERRAEALFQAAYITRTNGIELLGTEVEPDWHVHGGDFEPLSARERGGPDVSSQLIAASSDELRRASAHNADPETRWHYRYQAAALAWEAATLMPNNNDRTALMLWQGGWWLKGIAPETADQFYKALVRRNRQTELGAEADRRRWFPELDANGRPLPRKPHEPAPADFEQIAAVSRPPAEADDAQDSNEPNPLSSLSNRPGGGFRYQVHKGDSLAAIAAAAARLGLTSATIEEILAVNPGLDQARLKVGQVVNIPAVVVPPPSEE
jgi:hypothetical protein